MTHKRFYIMTLQYIDPKGTQVVASKSGYLTDIAEGMTEEAMYERLIDQISKEYGAPRARTAVLFYYLGKPEAQ